MMVVNQPTVAVRFGGAKKGPSVSLQLQGIDRSNSIEKLLGKLVARTSVVVIGNPTQLNKLWQTTAFQGQSKPQVDFRKQAAVLTLLSEGQEVKSVGVDKSGQLTVKVGAMNPMPLTAVMNYPWHVAVVDKEAVKTPPKVVQAPTYFP